MQSRFLASFLLFLVTFSIQAQDGNWKNLFNGKDLSGWKAVAGKANFTVQDGVIEGSAVFGTGNTFLITEELYGDYILEVDLKISHTSSNSGIMTRGQFDPAGRQRLPQQGMRADGNRQRYPHHLSGQALHLARGRRVAGTAAQSQGRWRAA